MGTVSGSQLQCVYPQLGASDAHNYAGLISAKFGGSLSTTCHWAAFLANVGTESAGLTEWTQNPCNAATAAPYCGRGPLQITGLANYRFCAGSGSCGCSGIVSSPAEASSGAIGVGTAFCVWNSLSGHSLSSDADGTLEGLRKTACLINAGHYPCSVLNGWASRQAYWAAANKCF